jgi:hypothetical protein
VKKLKITAQEKPWMKHLGKLKHLSSERKQIDRRVEEAFERIDREMWRRAPKIRNSGLELKMPEARHF